MAGVSAPDGNSATGPTKTRPAEPIRSHRCSTRATAARQHATSRAPSTRPGSLLQTASALFPFPRLSDHCALTPFASLGNMPPATPILRSPDSARLHGQSNDRPSGSPGGTHARQITLTHTNTPKHPGPRPQRLLLLRRFLGGTTGWYRRAQQVGCWVWRQPAGTCTSGSHFH